MEARALGRLGSRAAGEPRSPGLAAGRGRLDAAQFSRDGRGMIQGLGASRSKDTTQEWRRCPYMWGAPAKCPGGSGEPKVSDAVPRAQESLASPQDALRARECVHQDQQSRRAALGPRGAPAWGSGRGHQPSWLLSRRMLQTQEQGWRKDVRPLHAGLQDLKPPLAWRASEGARGKPWSVPGAAPPRGRREGLRKH